MEKVNTCREFIYAIRKTDEIAHVQLVLRELIDKNFQKDWRQNENIDFLEKVEKEIYKETEEESSVKRLTHMLHALELINDYKKILSGEGVHSA